MNYTQEQLEKMSCFEINKLAFDLKTRSISPLKFCSGYWLYGTTVAYSVIEGSEKIGVHKVDYCNNWGDCGDLIDELHIDLQHDQIGNGYHFAMDSNDSVTAKSDNVKRAITIIYILMKQDLTK